jgi:FGGY-family pentulose kinase
MTLLIGIDVGTGSARAGVFDTTGVRRGIGSSPIALHNPRPDFYEQSSADIWAACCTAVRRAMAESGAKAEDVIGLAFDATCSLVVTGKDGAPVTVSPGEADNWDVMVWMDHRAVAEAAAIDAAGHPLLAHVGGSVSPEMQTPKLAWLKQHNPAAWQRAERFFDLADWLSWKASGSDIRSLCTTVCKWAYVGAEDRWDAGWFRAAGLGDIADEGFARIGRTVAPIGALAGRMSAAAAADMGLAVGTAVGVGAIDAHAGAIGTIGGEAKVSLDRRLAMVAGTSSCHLIANTEPRFVEGVWGPYWGAMIPDLWLNEAGQSATGAVIDHIIDSHAQGAALRDRAAQAGTTVYALLNARIAATGDTNAQLDLTRDLHVCPDFHGNRSPFADPTLRGMVSGLSLANNEDVLASLYLATLQGLALGTRMIIDRIEAHGGNAETIILSGGGAKNPLFVAVLANACLRPILLPAEDEAMLLGSAMVAATAAGSFESLPVAMGAMSRFRGVVTPDPAQTSYYDRKLAVLQQMYADQRSFRTLMAG